MKVIAIFFLLSLTGLLCTAQKINTLTKDTPQLPGAYQLAVYLPLLQHKKVGVFANHTSLVGKVHLVDTLLKLGVNVIKIFAPEHGFRGTSDAGAGIGNDTDKTTGIPIISLYGKKLKPTQDDLKDVDVLLFDIQDVGVRFYTYIASLQYFMEAALETGKPLLILDRPNPNGFYVDGPVLDTAYKSFVGMQPVPVVYGMTIGEYAVMLVKEGWTNPKCALMLNVNNSSVNKEWNPSLKYLNLTIITCKNYSHGSRYHLPVSPSPNLAEQNAIYWYPSTCFFEGTTCSEGRGTDHPFLIFGHPSLSQHLYTFTPHSNEGTKEPKWKDKRCYGWNITTEETKPQLQLKWLLQAYKQFPQKDSFFIKPKSGKDTDYFFNKLVGNNTLMQQIISGKSEVDIRASWQQALQAFKKIRQKYLLYDDF